MMETGGEKFFVSRCFEKATRKTVKKTTWMVMARKKIILIVNKASPGLKNTNINVELIDKRILPE
jgi:hypothetical protein